MPDSKPQRVLVPFVLAATMTGLFGTGLFGCAGHLTHAHEALAIGDQDTAETYLRKAVNQSSTKDEASRMLSVLLAKRGQELASSEPRPAEDAFVEALELDPSNEQARLGLARLLMKRGSTAEARELLSAKECRSCGRLIAIMLHEEAVKAAAAGEISKARETYQEAFEIGNDPLDALGLAQTYLAQDPPDLAKSQALLETAAPLIARGRAEAENLFRQLRTQFLLAAAASKQNKLVLVGFDIRTEELLEQPEFDLRFKVAQEQFRSGDSDPAIESIRSLIENSGQYLEPTQREVMSAALVIMYSARAARHLQAGDPAGAARDIADARKIDGDNNRLKLQQILAIAGNGRIELGFKTLASDATPGKDSKQVKAILYTLQVFEALDANKVSRAEDYLIQAEELAADLPEVHLARAWLMSEQRNDDLSRKELQEARKLSQFDYPRGRINQYPGALAHLDRARKRVKEQGVLHPFRGPDFDKRITTLQKKLAEFYPYEVVWFAGEGGMLELLAEDGQRDVEYSGPRWLKGTAIASPGKPAEVPVPNVGLVQLEFDGKQVGVIAETHAHIKIKL